jgi:uncharacterized protein
VQAATEPRRPAPILTDDNSYYWEGAAAGRLVAQRCSDCGVVRHPPRPMCGHCHSLAFEVIDLSGRGTLYSYAILHHPRSPAFDYPVRAALVDLEEGIRVLSELTEMPTDDIRIGMALEVGFVPTVDGYAVPVFSPVTGSPAGDR